MQAAGQVFCRTWTGLDWRVCLLVLTLAAGVALCVSHGEAWQVTHQLQARLAQSALLARTRDAQAGVLGKLRAWQGSTGRLLLMQRCAMLPTSLGSAGLQLASTLLTAKIHEQGDLSAGVHCA